MIWLLVVVGLIALLIVSSFLHLNHKFHIIKTLLLFVILLIFIGSMLSWFNTEKTKLNTPKEIVNSVYLYVGWLGDIGTKVFFVGKEGVTLIGNAIKGNQTKILTNDGRK